MFGAKKNLNGISFKTDIHCHLLPCVDDGFRSFEDSIVAVRNMQDHGVEKIILTPHIDKNTFINNTEGYLREQFDLFITNIPKDIKIDFSLAAEYMIIPEFENNISNNLLYLNSFSSNQETKYILIEMSYFFESNNIRDAIFALVLADYKPVIAHPERYLYYTSQLNVFNDLHDMGAVFQLNMMSLSGVYGKESMIILDYLIKNNMYEFIASDLHSFKQYKSILDIKFPKKYFDYIVRLAENTTDKFLK